MRILTLTVGLLETNCYLVLPDDAPVAAVIDPGGDAPRILGALRSLHADVEWIINTHGHADHVAANAALKAAFPRARLAVHEADAPMLVDAALNLSSAFGMPVVSPPADLLLRDGDEISIGPPAASGSSVLSDRCYAPEVSAARSIFPVSQSPNLPVTQSPIRFRVIHVPGHTAGGIALYAPASQPPSRSAICNPQSAFHTPHSAPAPQVLQSAIPNLQSALCNLHSALRTPVLFSGDALFQGGIGRSDFPGGSAVQLLRSIRSRLLTLPPETAVFPGHGAPTTIAEESRSNPFLA